MSEQSFESTAESRTALDRDDRRSLERYICRRHTEVRVLAKPGCSAFPATIRDISQLGIGLVAEKSCPPGAFLALRLRSRDARFSDLLTATVRHSTPLPDGGWLLGCALSRSLTDDEILGLL
jgi:hypothetical protein